MIVHHDLYPGTGCRDSRVGHMAADPATPIGGACVTYVVRSDESGRLRHQAGERDHVCRAVRWLA